MKKVNFILSAKSLIQRMRNQNKYEYRLILLLTGLMVFVVLSGGIIFYQLNSIAFNVKLDRSENQSLLLMKDIQKNLVVLDNTVSSYSLLRQPEILDNYAQSKKTIKNQMSFLTNIQKDNQMRLKNTEIIKYQVQLKFNLLDSTLLVQNQTRVNDAMDKVLAQISDADITQRLSSLPKPSSKKSLLDKITGKRSKNYDPKVRVSTSSLDQLNEDIEALRREETLKEQEANKALFLLKEKGKTLSLAIASGFGLLEKNILDNLEQETEKASESSKVISYVLIVFSMLVAALIGITLGSIYLYIQKNKNYQKELKVAKKRSDDLAKTKERFLANMSHEIRTPLNAITGFAHLLTKEKMNPPQMEKVDIIHKSSLHLTDLINHILDLTKLQSNKMAVEQTRFNLRNELNWVIQVLEDTAKSRGNTLELNIGENVPVELKGDSMKLKQIILNLCGNAVKFTEKGSVKVDIQSIQLEEENVELRIRVVDTGIGISTEKQKSIFNEFEQAENSTQRQYGGTGLGLSITKKLIELLQGTLHLQSTVGNGTDITVHLPFVQENEKEKIAEVVATDWSSHIGKHILVVDDEPFNRKLLCTLLHQHNIFTEEAVNGAEAVEKAKKGHFDFIFMDLRMPIMDGNTATKLIRKDLKNGSPIIVALTANSQLLSEEDSIMEGFNAIVEKPFTESKLIDILNSKPQKQ